MRVAIVGNYPLDRTRIAGGVQAAFAYLVDGLRQFTDLDLHIVTIDHGNPHQYNRIQQDAVTVHLLPALPRFEFVRNYRTYQARLDETLARIRPDVVHAQDAAQGAYVALRSGYPTVITVHGIRREDSKHIGDFITRLRNQVHSIRIEEHSLRRTRHLIAISRYVTAYFAAILKPETEVYYIPNAIHHRFFDLEGAGDGRTVLFTGRVIKRKRPLDLVHAFARVAHQIPGAQLRLAGEYHSDARHAESVKTFIRRAGLQQQVHLLGLLPEDEVLQEFARCDVLALPSIQETTPMVIAQAMAAGKPVVATPVGGVGEMVSDGETGFLVDVGDIDGLADRLLRLLGDPSLRSRMGQLGHEFAMQNYHADSVAMRTYDVYRRIAAAGR